MNKADLTDAVAKRTGLTKKDAEAAINAVMAEATQQMANGGKLVLTGFGSFETYRRAARTGVNPRTGAALQIPPANVPAFRPGKALKEALNK